MGTVTVAIACARCLDRIGCEVHDEDVHHAVAQWEADLERFDPVRVALPAGSALLPSNPRGGRRLELTHVWPAIDHLARCCAEAG